MSDTNQPSPLFWIAGILFLLWNLFGCYFYYLDVSLPESDYVARFGQEMWDVRGLYPAWSIAGYAIGVWGGLVAAILFLLRKKPALLMFILSLIGAFVSFTWAFTSPEHKAAAGPQFWIMPITVIVIGMIEIWVTRKKIAKGVLS